MTPSNYSNFLEFLFLSNDYCSPLDKIDCNLKLVTPPGYPDWDVQREIKCEYQLPSWVKKQHVNREIINKKSAKAAAILQSGEKKKKYKAKLKREEAKRIKQLIDKIVEEEEEKKALDSQSSLILDKSAYTTSNHTSISVSRGSFLDSRAIVKLTSSSKGFTSISSRKKMNHPPVDPNTTPGSLITD